MWILIFYNHNDLDSAERCREEIRKHIASIEEGDTKLSNPITSTIELEKLRDSTDPEARQTGEILDLLIALRQDVDSLKKPKREGSSTEMQSYTVPFFAAIKKLEYLRDAILDWTNSSLNSDTELEPLLAKLRKEVSGRAVAVMGTFEDSIKALDVDLEAKARMARHVREAMEIAKKYSD